MFLKALKTVGKIIGLCIAAPILWFGISFIISLVLAIPASILHLVPNEHSVTLLIYASMAVSVPVTLWLIVTQSKKNGGDIFLATVNCLLLAFLLSN